MSSKNPYPETLVDETSGIKVSNSKHIAWERGYIAATRRIHLVMHVGKMVIVFDGNGAQMPAYQGEYDGVRAHILRDVPPYAVFFSEIEGIVNKENW